MRSNEMLGALAPMASGALVAILAFGADGAAAWRPWAAALLLAAAGPVALAPHRAARGASLLLALVGWAVAPAVPAPWHLVLPLATLAGLDATSGPVTPRRAAAWALVAALVALATLAPALVLPRPLPHSGVLWAAALGALALALALALAAIRSSRSTEVPA